MLKKNSRMFVLLILLSACISACLYTDNTSKNKINNFEEDILYFNNFEKDKKLLRSIYVENSNFSYFMPGSQYDRFSNDFNLPMLYYYLEMNSNILQNDMDKNIITKISEFTNNYLSTLDVKKIDSLNYEEIYWLSSIDKFTKNNENESIYIAFINSIFLENNNFNISDLNDYLYYKYLFKIMENIEYFPPEIENLLYDEISASLVNELFFTDSTDNLLFPVETELLYLSDMFNKLSSIKHIDISTYENWYKEYIQLVSEMLFSEELDIFVATLRVMQLESLNKLYSVSFDTDRYNLFIERVSAIDLDGIIYTDYVLAYQILLIISSDDTNNFKEYQQEIENFKRFIYSYSNFANIKEQYYGLLLAEQFDLEIDDISFLNYVNSYTLNDIKSIYFYCLIYKKIGIDISDSKTLEIVDSINAYDDRIDLSNIYYIIATKKLLNISFEKSEIAKINEIAETFIKQYTTEEELYNYILAKELMGKEISNEWVSDNVDRFYSQEGGFSYIAGDSNFNNILSTFRMIQLIERYNLNIELNFNDINKFVLSAYGFDGGYLLLNSPHYEEMPEIYLESFSLESWYGGVYVYNYLLNLDK